MKNIIEKTLSAYHMTGAFLVVDPEISNNANVKFFYLAPTSTTPTPSINSQNFTQQIVKSYGPFYSIGGGDAGRGAIYINFYQAIKR